jgi:hypothetical protein
MVVASQVASAKKALLATLRPSRWSVSARVWQARESIASGKIVLQRFAANTLSVVPGATTANSQPPCASERG